MLVPACGHQYICHKKEAMHSIRKIVGTIIITVLATIEILQSQNIGIGTATPLQLLDVNGAIRVGGTTVANTGAIRWNEIKNDFEGFNGVAWVSLTGGKGKWGDQLSYSTENTSTHLELVTSTVEGEEFGYNISAEGDWMVAGAYRDGVPNQSSKWAAGSIRVFQRNNDLWQEKYAHYDPDTKTNDFFGVSVGMTPTHIIAGAPNADAGIINDIGKAYIYTFNQNGSALQSTLSAPDGQSQDNFGCAVAISGDVAVIGASGNDVSGISNMGSAYVFTRTGNTWSHTTTLIPSDGSLDDYFGSFVSVWGNYIAVSTPFKTINGFPYAGKTYVYYKTGGSWLLISNLVSPNPSSLELFGYDVCVRDNILLVGAPETTDPTVGGAGAVYVYQLDNLNVTYKATLQASDGAIGDGLGVSVTYKDNLILAGAPIAAVGASANQGKAYIFRLINNVWTEEAILTSSTNEEGINFGRSAALTTGFAMVGAPYAEVGEKLNNGKVLFFKQY